MNCQWELAKMTAERDAAQQMVAELRATLTTGRDIVIETSTGSRHTKWVEQAYDAIEASAHIAGRWCLASERDAVAAWAEQHIAALQRTVVADAVATLDAVIARADAAEARAEREKARAEEAEGRIQRTEAVTNGALDAVIARLDSFESNVVAQEARLKFAKETIEKLFAAAMAGPTGDSVADAEDAKNAWDAVQGDVVAPVEPDLIDQRFARHLPWCACPSSPPRVVLDCYPGICTACNRRVKPSMTNEGALTAWHTVQGDDKEQP